MFRYKASILLLLLSVRSISYCQLSRSQIKKNNYRQATYRGNIRNHFGLDKRYQTVGITLNALNYFGDLSPTTQKLSTDLTLTKPAIGITHSHRVGSRFTIRESLLYGRIQGSDNVSADNKDISNGSYRYNRNLSFRNTVKELSLVMIIDYFENQSGYLSRVNWTPYAFLGLAVFHHNPQAQVPATDLNGNAFINAGEWVSLRPLGTEGQYANLHQGDANFGIKPYKLIQPAIPLGVGVRFRLADQFDLAVEYSVRYLFTDYIDDVSKNYVDLGALDNNIAKALSYRSNEIASPNYQYISKYDNNSYSVIAGYGSEYKDNLRGNKNDRDIYTVFTLNVSYLLARDYFKKPKFR